MFDRNRALKWLRKGVLLFGSTLLFHLLASGIAQAADPTGIDTLLGDPGAPVDYIWVAMSAFLVFIMQAGFAMLEGGLTRAKNTTNLMLKNIMDFSMCSLAYMAIGFAFMFGASKAGLIGSTGWFLLGDTYDVGTYLLFLFQVMFAGTAATIASGAVAERMRWRAYFVYSIVVGAVIYPIFGHWVWGGGWLSTLPLGVGHVDFAGSGVVHTIGGIVGLTGTMVLGPRFGKYINGKPRAIPGHSISMAALGCFLLWFGWFGFNAGSTLSAHELRIAVVSVNTSMAAAAGAFAAMLFTWIKTKKPDASMTINGAIAGLVAITASCAWIEGWAAVIIGLVAGILVVPSVYFFDRIGIDDPVGAISVHAVNGVWGLLSVGLFADGTYGLYTTAAPHVVGLFYGGGFGQLAAQAVGAVVCIVWAFVLGYILFKSIDKFIGMRVSPQEELEGLDLSEHGTRAYPNFPYLEG